jgi:two-component system osmolarity sensor histidine kinase EnvZ
VSLGAAIETIAPGGPSEIRALAKSFNQMTKRITAAESERAFILAGVSHDLRTPLAKLSLAVEMIPEAGEMRDMAARQVVQMDRLVGQFLDYARGFEAEASTRVDLAGLLRETVAEIDDQRRVRLVAPVYLVATVRREAIRRATINLVDNALNHGGADVVLTLTRTGNQFEIIASDKGPGVAAEALAGLAQPFRRGPNVGAANGGVANGGGSAGAGLGLAIVARIAAEHCGRLELRNRPGGGFEAVFQAPIAAPGSIGP